MSRKKVAHKFQVVFQAEDSVWNVSIPAVDGCFSYGRSLAEARRNIRECLGLFEEQLGPHAAKIANTAEFEEDIRWPRAARDAARKLEREKARAEEAARKLRKSTAEAARSITGQLSLRDAGELLGMSQEGVRKLLKAG
ncbi:MAG TPA: type II toxin-antitoxin system HicB family antitoxin [Polyangiaceae bacterium]|nr:type II toxin-antitoxin system HicB family antitoxin [Polyangiaceae bacterium]